MKTTVPHGCQALASQAITAHDAVARYSLPRHSVANVRYVLIAKPTQHVVEPPEPTLAAKLTQGHMHPSHHFPSKPCTTTAVAESAERTFFQNKAARIRGPGREFIEVSRKPKETRAFLIKCIERKFGKHLRICIREKNPVRQLREGKGCGHKS